MAATELCRASSPLALSFLFSKRHRHASSEHQDRKNPMNHKKKENKFLTCVVFLCVCVLLFAAAAAAAFAGAWQKKRTRGNTRKGVQLRGRACGERKTEREGGREGGRERWRGGRGQERKTGERKKEREKRRRAQTASPLPFFRWVILSIDRSINPRPRPRPQRPAAAAAAAAAAARSTRRPRRPARRTPPRSAP